MNKYITLIGLGAVGAPLADLLYKKYDNDFALLSSESFLSTLESMYINDEAFTPQIFSKKEQLKKRIGIVFVCVKNYQIDLVSKLLKSLIDESTVIVPLQNGLYSFDLFKKEFPKNIVLEGFAQGPNTKVMKNVFTYQKPGAFHIGSSNKDWKKTAENVVDIMSKANVNAFYEDDIKYQVWKKLMLNVAGNAITALTGIDYCMFVNSKETQYLCRRVMEEFIAVANMNGINLSSEDIDDTINYFLSFKVSKKTSMLEDVLNKRHTENDYIAGYLCKLGRQLNIKTPYIDSLYNLIKIKEDVYLLKL